MEDNILKEKLTFGERIKYFFTKPSILFGEFIEKPKYFIYMIILSVVTIFYTLVSSKYIKEVTDRMLDEKLKGYDAQAVAMAKKTTDIFSNPIIQSIGSVFGVIVGIYFISFLYFLIIKVAKEKISFTQTVAIYCLASMSTAIGSIIKTLYMLISNKGIGLDVLSHPTIGNTISKSVDIFIIWQYILLAIGISVVGKMSKKKGAIISILIFLLTIGFSILTVLPQIK